MRVQKRNFNYNVEQLLDDAFARVAPKRAKTGTGRKKTPAKKKSGKKPVNDDADNVDDDMLDDNRHDDQRDHEDIDREEIEGDDPVVYENGNQEADVVQDNGFIEGNSNDNQNPNDQAVQKPSQPRITSGSNKTKASNKTKKEENGNKAVNEPRDQSAGEMIAGREEALAAPSRGDVPNELAQEVMEGIAEKNVAREEKSFIHQNSDTPVEDNEAPSRRTSGQRPTGFEWEVFQQSVQEENHKHMVKLHVENVEPTAAELKEALDIREKDLAAREKDLAKRWLALAAHENFVNLSYKVQLGSYWFKLPAELRNRIYKDVLIADDNLLLERIRWPSSRTHAINRNKHPERFCPQLLQVCKRINSEVVNFLWGENTFQFEDLNVGQSFIMRSASRAQQIRRIRTQYVILHKQREDFFDCLAFLPNLERVEIDLVWTVGLQTSENDAHLFWVAAQKWFKASALRAGNRGQAALDLLVITSYNDSIGNPVSQAEIDRFRHDIEGEVYHYL
ncbi:uncharacterized protein N0V89_002210 [Didymosphaeria variabile]|uniref:F-box domain-containing protein n=1 Tax=Didymosphaeria variabile TaxID=1932322 RepID=A0A9W8XS90_9PLEO|nr:uncharacterized protein N0V89_002210 [Didymosphaeria variabile]KAJ4357634.1 hypothetical protein N0V89_002210 [Didymosphaeria variabile]